MNRYVEWVKQELEFLRDGDPMNERMYRHLLHMCEEFAKENHSGFLAAYTANALNKLFRWLPLRPLTGEDDEWIEVADNLWQNKRCSRVFKDASGRAWDIDGRVFIDKDGCAFTNKDSRVEIAFPYTPTTEYVKIKGNEK